MLIGRRTALGKKNPASQPTKDRTFRPDVEGLRAIAVLMVLLNHAGLTALRGGYVGVDVFFVLSGFLITGLLLKEVEATGRVSLPDFYARRARRLLPAGTLVLVTTVVGSYLYLGESRAERVAVDAQWSALFASNFRFIQQETDYFGAELPPSPLQHYWSLAVEEQFYAVWPAIISLVAMVGTRIPIRLKLSVVLAFIIAASLIWSIYMTPVDGTVAYFSPLSRASELGAGAFLAVIAPRLLTFPRWLGVASSWLGVAAILASGLWFTETTPFPGYAVVLPVLATVLAVAGGTIAPGGGADVILRQRPFQWIGMLSYSLYLWHWPVLVVGAARADRDLTLIENLILCVVALGLSTFTFVLLEQPVRSSVFLKARPAMASIAVGASLVFFCFVSTTLLISTLNGRGEVFAKTAQPIEFPTNNQIVAAVAAGANVDVLPEQPPLIESRATGDECNITRKDSTPEVCVHGDPNGTRTAVIYGDSHSAMWTPAFDVIGRQAHWKIVQLSKQGCQVPDFPRYTEQLKREYTECADFRSFALAKIEELRPDVVILTSAYSNVRHMVDGEPTREGIEEAWDEGLATMINRIKPHTDRVVVIGDIPFAAEPGIECLLGHPDDVQACNTPYVDGVDAEHNKRERAVAETNGADYVDVVPWFCTSTTCPAVIGGLTTYHDAYHATANYAIWLSEALGEATGLLREGTDLAPVAATGEPLFSRAPPAAALAAAP